MQEVIAKQIGSHGRRLYASPAYSKERGLPKDPDDLAKHRIITTSTVPRLNDWPFIIDGKVVTCPMHGQLRASSTTITQEMALAGLGICRVHDLIAAPLVQRTRTGRGARNIHRAASCACLRHEPARTASPAEDQRLR